LKFTIYRGTIAPMLDIDKSIHRIQAFAVETGKSPAQFAAEAKIPASTARDLLSGRGNPTRDTIRAMESVVPRDFRR